MPESLSNHIKNIESILCLINLVHTSLVRDEDLFDIIDHEIINDNNTHFINAISDLSRSIEHIDDALMELNELSRILEKLNQNE